VPFISHQNLEDSKEIWEKFGAVANKYLGKVTEAFQKIPSSFGAVVRKPGLGLNYPPPLATLGLNKGRTKNVTTDILIHKNISYS